MSATSSRSRMLKPAGCSSSAARATSSAPSTLTRERVSAGPSLSSIACKTAKPATWNGKKATSCRSSSRSKNYPSPRPVLRGKSSCGRSRKTKRAPLTTETGRTTITKTRRSPFSGTAGGRGRRFINTCSPPTMKRLSSASKSGATKTRATSTTSSSAGNSTRRRSR